jgi:Zn-dependent metalloprotease
MPMPARDVLHCILPPYILEKLASSDNPVVRDHALTNIAASAETRGVRMMTAAATPMFAAMAAPTAKKHRLIYDMKGKPPTPFMLPGKLVRSEGEKKAGDDAVNEAYDYTGHTYDFYKRVLGRNSLDGNGMKLISSVHAGKGFNNALWNGTQMIYGDGDTVIFGRFTQSLDIVGHELTHGVVTFTCDLEYQDEPGALNEHFADVFGSLIKQWRNKETAKQANWLIGEDIVIKTETRKALRSMAKPGDAFRGDPYLGDDPQPAHMDKKYKGSADYGGVHLNSGIPNHAFYLVATGLGGRAWEKAGKIWYDALLQLNRKSDFQECARITHQVAGDHGANTQQVVKEAWKAVGLSV